MYVKPAPGLVTRDPVRKDLLPPEGREVPDDDFYWVARVRDGDVIKCDPPGQSPAPSPPTAKTKPRADAAPTDERSDR